MEAFKRCQKKEKKKKRVVTVMYINLEEKE